MLRVVFDTNVYGLLILEDIEAIKARILGDKEFIVYGAKIIRDELRDTPKDVKLRNASVRNLMLELYDKITQGRRLESSNEVEKLALGFYIEYRKIGGIRPWHAISEDFRIVANACIHGMDIIVSEDFRTMTSTKAVEAYKRIALECNLRIPNFLEYKYIKNRYGF